MAGAAAAAAPAAAADAEGGDTCKTASGGETLLAFAVDTGSESEYRLEVRLPPLAAAARGGGAAGAAAAQLEGELRELERVYQAEGLPEWHCHSFLAVAALLAADDDDGDAWDGAWDGGGARAPRERGRDALDELRALAPGQLQLLIDDAAGWLTAAQPRVRGACAERGHLPWLSQPPTPDADAADSEEAVLGLYSTLMRDARTGTAIVELMEGFWREGHALADRRKAEVRDARALAPRYARARARPGYAVCLCV